VTGKISQFVTCFLVILLLNLTVGVVLFSKNIGSDRKVSNLTSQQKVGKGDRVATFAFCRWGFQLSSSSVSATWDSIFPVSGNVELNGGTLSLGVDLVFNDVATIVDLGSIVGNNYKMELPPSIESFPQTPDSGDFTDLNVIFNGDVSVNASTITFKGDSSINGMGNCLDLGQNSTIVIDSNSSLSLKNITIAGILGSNIYCTDDTGVLYLDNVRFLLDGDFDFNYGKFEIVNDFHVIGDGYIFSYQTDQESVIKTNGRLILDQNITFSYSPPTANRDLIKLYDETSELVLRGATLFSTIAGLRLTKGKMIALTIAMVVGWLALIIHLWGIV